MICSAARCPALDAAKFGSECGQKRPDLPILKKARFAARKGPLKLLLERQTSGQSTYFQGSLPQPAEIFWCQGKKSEIWGPKVSEMIEKWPKRGFFARF